MHLDVFQIYWCKLPEAIKSRVDEMREELDNIQPKSFASNISKEVRRAIDQLCKNRSLTIRKGSCIVVMDTAQYIEEGYNHLADDTIYKKPGH